MQNQVCDPSVLDAVAVPWGKKAAATSTVSKSEVGPDGFI